MKNKSVIYVRTGSVPDIEGLRLSTGRPVCEVNGHPAEAILDTEPVSLRDRFAGEIVAGLLIGAMKFSVGTVQPNDNGRFAQSSYALADAMIAEREKKGG